jgi:hypothetical protein
VSRADEAFLFVKSTHVGDDDLFEGARKRGAGVKMERPMDERS